MSSQEPQGQREWRKTRRSERTTLVSPDLFCVQPPCPGTNGCAEGWEIQLFRLGAGDTEVLLPDGCQDGSDAAPPALLMTQIVSSRSTRGFSVAKLIHVFFDWFERGIARSDQVPSEVMNAAQRNIDFHFLIIPCSDCGQDVTTQTGMV